VKRIRLLPASSLLIHSCLHIRYIVIRSFKRSQLFHHPMMRMRIRPGFIVTQCNGASARDHLSRGTLLNLISFPRQWSVGPAWYYIIYLRLLSSEAGRYRSLYLFFPFQPFFAHRCQPGSVVGTDIPVDSHPRPPPISFPSLPDSSNRTASVDSSFFFAT